MQPDQVITLLDAIANTNLHLEQLQTIMTYTVGILLALVLITGIKR